MWYDLFHMGIVHFMAYPDAKTQQQIIESVKKILIDEFFQAIEVSALVDEDTLVKIGKMCDTARVQLLIAAQPLVLSYKLNLNSLDEKERLKAVEKIKQVIDRAYISGAKAVALLSGKMPQEDQIETAKNKLVESLVELCDYAQAKADNHGYTLAVNLEIFDWSVDKKALVGPAPIAFDIASKVRTFCKNFGLTVDLSHQPLLFEDSFYTISLLSAFITHAHIGNAVLQKDHPAYGDMHPRFGIKNGSNDIDELTYFLKALLKNNYFEKKTKPVVSFEIKPLPDEDPELVIANAKRTFLTSYARLKEVL